MPLAFPSLSHGQVAFGFFNIDTDLLLLEHYFIFADRFCGHISRLADSALTDSARELWAFFRVEPHSEIGDLMGAIHGVRHTGLIGEVYTRFPFPSVQSEFKQKPDGDRTRTVIEEILRRYAVEVQIPFVAERSTEIIRIGEYRFSRHAFLQLVDYVWVGGYPRWKDEIRPGYVVEMKESAEQSSNWLFKDLKLS